MSALMIHPLKFFNQSSDSKGVMKANPGYVQDASIDPATLIPVCSTCNTGEGVVREEKDELTRYRCIMCGFRTSWTDKDEAAQEWADNNAFDDDN